MKKGKRKWKRRLQHVAIVSFLVVYSARRSQAVGVLSSKIVQIFPKGKVVFHETRP